MKNIKNTIALLTFFSVSIAINASEAPTSRRTFTRNGQTYVLPENFEDESWRYTLSFGGRNVNGQEIKRDPHWGFVGRKFVRRNGWIWRNNKWICDPETNPDCVDTN